MKALVPCPKITEFVVNVVAPVPPFATVKAVDKLTVPLIVMLLVPEVVPTTIVTEPVPNAPMLMNLVAEPE